jgi:uncharacterized SAM-binding protein YcdF (DUF218 family)
MKPSRFRPLRVALGLCALFVFLAALLASRWLGPWLLVNEPLARADVIFVTDGQTPQRELEGAALFLEGWAPRVALALPRSAIPAAVQQLAGEPEPQQRAWQVLRRRGVPEAAIVRLERVVENTDEELQVDFDYARAHGFRRVIIVSSPYHTRRVRMIWHSRSGDALPAIVRVTRYEPVDPSRWWRSRRSLEAVSHEVFGIANFLLGGPIPTFDRGEASW